MFAQNHSETQVVDIAERVNNNQKGSRLARLGIAAGMAALLAGCGGSSAVEMDATTSLSCNVETDGRQLPSKLGANAFEDSRAGDITACHYLSD